MASSIFSLEVAARLDRAPNLLPLLRSVIADHPQTVGLQQKWQLYRRASEALVGNLGSEARMNLPGRESGNWTFRFAWDQVTPAITKRLADYVTMYDR